MARRFVVGVMGSGSDPHESLTVELGQWLGSIGVHLLTGGGDGVMHSVSKAFYEVPDRQGLVLGILPSGQEEISLPGYPNPWVEIAIQTHLPYSGRRGVTWESRNHINILSSDVVIFLPGGAGTRSELALAILYNKPAIVYGYSDNLNDSEVVQITDDLELVKAFVRAHMKSQKAPL